MRGVTWAIEQKGYSQRRACGLVGMEPKTFRNASRRLDDTEIRQRLAHWRLHLLLEREGNRLNHKKLFRLSRQEKLGVCKRGGRKQALGTRLPMVLPEARTSADCSTSCRTLSTTAVCSGCWLSSTTSPASASLWSSTRCSPASG